jgi:hypothetical protein
MSFIAGALPAVIGAPSGGAALASACEVVPATTCEVVPATLFG